MTRTLKDYRPQHDEGCASGVTDEMGYFPHTDENGNPNVPCTCGLDALLAVVPRPEPATTVVEVYGMARKIVLSCGHEIDMEGRELPKVGSVFRCTSFAHGAVVPRPDASGEAK